MIPVFRPTIKRKDMDSVLNCMVNDTLGPGRLVHEFELEMAKFIGAAHAVAYSSYYAALMVAVRALGLQPADKVIISALSPAIYKNILEGEGLVPLVLDVNPDSGVIDFSEIEKAMPSQPRGILLHYTLGFLPDIEQILNLNIPVIEDISQCLGSKKEEHFFGCFGNLAVFSLKPESILTAAEGGIVFTRDKKHLQAIKKINEELKQSLLLSDFNASLGLTQLKELDAFLVKRRQIQSTFSQALMKSRHKAMFQQEEYERVAYAFPVILISGLKDVQNYCRKKNIETLQPFTGTLAAYDEIIQQNCPHAKKLLMRTILFPLYPLLGKSNVEHIARVIGTLP